MSAGAATGGKANGGRAVARSPKGAASNGKATGKASGKDSGKAPGTAAGDQQGKGWKPSFNPWLIAVVVTMAAFMEILDTTIVNVALPYIAGSLSVSNDQATYALTAYLVANAIVLTVSGWISDTIGRKRYFLICIGMFTVCSFLCGISQSLGQLILFRALQGFFGGGLQPNQQSIILDTFEPAQRGRAFSIVAVATIIAPIIGPTLGGYITDNATWRWIFLINIPVGLFAFFAVGALVEDPPWIQARRRKLDTVGLALITIGLGCLQVALDRGEDADWLASPFIRVMALLAVLGILGAIGWLLTAKNPVVNLYVMADRNFALGLTMIAAMGFILYSGSIIIPQFAQQVVGYTATLAGLILSPGGIGIIILIPIMNRLLPVVQTRVFILIGFAVMGCAFLYSSTLSPDVDFWTLVTMRATQSAGLGFLFVPISTIAYTTLDKRLNGDAAALYTMFRNVSGSIGISTATALITQRSQIRQSHLSAWATPLNQPYNTLVAQYEAALRTLGRASSMVHSQAVGQVFQQFRQQATVLAYSDVFALCALLAFSMVPLTLLFSPTKAASKGGPPAH